MDKISISSKYLNLLNLASLIHVMDNEKKIDGALLLTSFGLIVGKIDTPNELTNKSVVADLIANQKKSLVDNSKEEGNVPIELIGDGSMLVVKDATIKYSNNSTININEITLHCDQIIGFAPVNIQDFLNQCIS